MNNERNSLESLVGDELSGVCFIRDYIELHFDGPFVRMIGDVSVQNDSMKKKARERDFRDFLCRNIGRKLNSVGPTSGNHLEFKFHGNDVIRVEGHEIGVEFAHFIAFPSKKLQIWEMD